MVSIFYHPSNHSLQQSGIQNRYTCQKQLKKMKTEPQIQYISKVSGSISEEDPVAGTACISSQGLMAPKWQTWSWIWYQLYSNAHVHPTPQCCLLIYLEA